MWSNTWFTNNDNCNSAASRHVNYVVSVCWRCRPASGTGNEGSWRSVSSPADVQDSHHIIIMPSQPSHLAFTDNWAIALTQACSIILSQLDYCISVWHIALVGNTGKLQCAQNTVAWSSAAKTVSHSNHYWNSCTGFQSTNV